jgi:hypothetical protein
MRVHLERGTATRRLIMLRMERGFLAGQCRRLVCGEVALMSVVLPRPLQGYHEGDRSSILNTSAVSGCALRTDQYSAMTDEIHEK